jgi:AraC-like DNA-binding protein
MYLPQALFDACCAPPGWKEVAEATFVHDAILLRLVQAAAAVSNQPLSLPKVYLDGLCLAIAAKISSTEGRFDPPRATGRSGSNSPRIRRVEEYVAIHLGEPIRLAELAAVAGVSKMRFAEQFKAATGLSPHQYVLQQRVALAQDLLLVRDSSVADVAMAVGFQSQAHFTGVFRTFIGETPDRWRRRMVTFTAAAPD